MTPSLSPMTEPRETPPMSGRKLDALVAEKVMGLTMANEARTFVEVPNSADEIEGGTMVEVAFLPEYSTDIAAAWTVVEKLKAMSVHLCLGPTGSGGWRASIYLPKYLTSYGETAPLAICLVALQTMNALHPLVHWRLPFPADDECTPDCPACREASRP